MAALWKLIRPSNSNVSNWDGERTSGASLFYLRTSTDGRANWPLLTQNSFVWLHLFLQFSINRTIPVLFFLLPPAPSLLLDAVLSCTHKFKLILHPSRLWFCVHLMHPSLYVCSRRSYIPPHGKCYDYIFVCIKENACAYLSCPSCILALFCLYIFLSWYSMRKICHILLRNTEW